MPLFNFRLTPLERIDPFGSEGNYNLNWFGLSDGCYWLRVGEAELFRATPAYLKTLDVHLCDPYVDYYVVRLWEDLLEMLPAVLTPVPAPLRERLAPANKSDWYEQISRWFDRNDDLRFEQKVNAKVNATEWLRVRHLHTSYLLYSPSIWLWSDETHVHVEWDNRYRLADGSPMWEAHLGSFAVPREDFLTEVRAFHVAFMRAMRARVDVVVEEWDRPEIAIDQAGLVEEHAQREARLDEVLRRAEQMKTDDWAGILEVAAMIEADEERHT